MFRKSKLTITFIFLSIYSIGQTKSTDSLIKMKLNLKNEIRLLEDSIKKIDKEILISDLKKNNSLYKEEYVESKTLSNAKLRVNPNPLSEIISELPANQKIKIYDYYSSYYGVCVDDLCGYMNEIWIKENDSLIKFRNEKIELYNEKIKLQEEIKKTNEKKSIEALEAKYIKKYGVEIYKKLKRGNYWLGMTEEMAIISLGEPTTINRTVGRWGVHEQWVYSTHKIYLYFENGKLSSFQD